MTRKLAPLLGLLTLSCTAPAPTAKSLCDLPIGLPGWSGTDVQWRGLLLAARHGTSFIAQDCRRRGVQIVGFSDPAQEQMIDLALHPRGTDWFEADIRAKIVDRGLYIQSIDKLRPIDEEEGIRRSKRLGF
jgi:hypothetical protein